MDHAESTIFDIHVRVDAKGRSKEGRSIFRVAVEEVAVVLDAMTIRKERVAKHGLKRLTKFRSVPENAMGSDVWWIG